MSKKFYVAPDMEELALETEGFIAASGDPGDGDPITNPGEAGEEDLV